MIDCHAFSVGIVDKRFLARYILLKIALLHVFQVYLFPSTTKPLVYLLQPPGLSLLLL